jgi:hypothetical protein
MPCRSPLPDSGQTVPTAASSYKQLPHRHIGNQAVTQVCVGSRAWTQWGSQYKVTLTKLRLAVAAMGQKETLVSELCEELELPSNLRLHS